MPLEFDGTKYKTISDVLAEFKTSAKTVKKAVKAGELPEPKEVQQGKRKFKHYDDAWFVAAKKYFNN